MKREEIDDKFKWDLSLMYKSTDEFKEDLEKVKKEIPQIADYKEKFLNTAEDFLEFFELFERINRTLEKLSMYTHLWTDVEPQNDIAQDLRSKVLGVAQMYSNEVTFIDTSVVENEEKVKEIIADERCKNYVNYINSILRYKPHILDDKTEEILTKAQNAMNAYKTYTSIKLDYEPVVIDGKEHFLNDETMREFLRMDDEDIRIQAYEKVYKEYKKFSNIFANTLEGKIKEDVFNAQVRNFNSPVESAVFGDEVTPDLFNMILNVANEKYHEYFLEYLEVSAKALNKEIYTYDLYVPLAKAPDKKYTLDEAFELIFEATKNYGEEYRKILEKARDEKWIDYLPHEGKRQGAYSSGCYDTVPYILTSFNGDMESVYTLIHELGHSCHSYFSNHNQDYMNSDYRIFVAEVASTVNENLLTNLMLQKAETKEEKAFLLFSKLERFVGTCYRQPFFADFENKLHNMVANNEGLSAKSITDLYNECNEKYYGGKVNLHEYSRYSCFAVPHFYYNYYVYKYTIGNCVASVLAKRIFEGDKEQIEKYLNFLKSGSIKAPVELLKDAGVDPLDENLYKEAFEGFKKDLDEFKKIIEE